MTTNAPSTLRLHPVETPTVMTLVGELPADQVRQIRQDFYDEHGNIVVRTDRFLEKGGQWVGNDAEVVMNPKNLPG